MPTGLRRQLMPCILHPSRFLMRHTLSIHLSRALYRGVSLVTRRCYRPRHLNSSILFCCCFCCRRCRIIQNASMAIIAMPPTAAPTPMPALAPSERPVEDEDEDEGESVPVAVGTPVVAEAACLPNWAGMFIALSELQQVVLSTPQHHVLR